MKISIETKYNIGQKIYLAEKETIKGTFVDGYVRAYTIDAIIIDGKDGYKYKLNDYGSFYNHYYD